MLNTIYIISNMHLNYHLGIRPSDNSPPQKVPPTIPILLLSFCTFSPLIN